MTRFRLRLRAALMVGRMDEWKLRVNARQTTDPWIAALCQAELERRASF